MRIEQQSSTRPTQVSDAELQAKRVQRDAENKQPDKSETRASSPVKASAQTATERQIQLYRDVQQLTNK